MKKLVLFIVGWSVCLMVWAQEHPEAGPEKVATCSACHGLAGVSSVPLSPSLAGQNQNYLLRQLLAFRAGLSGNGEQGRYDPVMGAMTMALDEQDMRDIAAYYAGLPEDGSQSGVQSDSMPPESEQEDGARLYHFGDRQRNIMACSACHGPSGKGIASSGFPDVSGQREDYLKLQLHKFRDGSRHNDLNGMMQDIARSLADKEIESLADYMTHMN
ncbi:c-type cytochrome [Vibrio mangrovi]|uniref:C-type cytochrome n=1 Tax=Vibrio mangrovi TaxID=474394 RepID=A0A1Y6IW64_9VIBR|nr:c-type cytochrome [Vibrio mangrovi]MDW6002563.1 c-type cytochrome [Vibrio mangrovi]SMS01904.1 Cytochrome c4 precursor [Vibrio mangrovi]